MKKIILFIIATLIFFLGIRYVIAQVLCEDGPCYDDGTKITQQAGMFFDEDY